VAAFSAKRKTLLSMEVVEANARPDGGSDRWAARESLPVTETPDEWGGSSKVYGSSGNGLF
jgi:hypothetical protein